MKLYYENGDWLFCVERKNNNFVKYNINKSLGDFILKDFVLNDKNVFLLDENRFNFFSFDVFVDTKKNFNIKDFKDILKDKQNYIEANYPKNGVLLTYFVDDIYLDGQKMTYFLGIKGKIYFRLKFIYLDYRSQNLFKIFTGNKFYENKEIAIYPQSFFTLNFVRESINRDDFNVLYIYPEYAKLLTIKKGFYNGIFKIDMGIDKLKCVFKDNGIENIYTETFLNTNFNDFALEIINGSFEFYCKLLVKWIKEQGLNQKDLILVSKLGKNQYFLDNFSRNYSKDIGGYVLPFNSSKNFKDKKFDKLKMLDLQIFANLFFN